MEAQQAAVTTLSYCRCGLLLHNLAAKQQALLFTILTSGFLGVPEFLLAPGPEVNSEKKSPDVGGAIWLPEPLSP
jgi:hypothetical protein